MLLTDYLESIENTEQEQLFLEKLSEIKDDLAHAASVPVVGKLIQALIAMGESECIWDFKQTEHYENIMGFNIYVGDLEKGQFSIYPGRAHLMQMAAFAAVVGGVILLLWLCLRRCRRR